MNWCLRLELECFLFLVTISYWFPGYCWCRSTGWLYIFSWIISLQNVGALSSLNTFTHNEYIFVHNLHGKPFPYLNYSLDLIKYVMSYLEMQLICLMEISSLYYKRVYLSYLLPQGRAYVEHKIWKSCATVKVLMLTQLTLPCPKAKALRLYQTCSTLNALL